MSQGGATRRLLAAALAALAAVAAAPARAADGGPAAANPLAAAGPAPQPYGVVGVDVPAKGAGAAGDDEIRARLNGEIWIEVRNLGQWLQKLKDDQRLGKDEDVHDLVPYFDGVALTGVHPTNPEALPRRDAADEILRLHFDLERHEGNKSAWAHLLNEPALERRIGASVGFEGGREMPTLVTPEAPERNQKLYLVIIPRGRALTGFGLIGGSLLLFLVLAARTDIIRDTNSPLRPDGRRPFSLARSQMAFWFFLVSASYFLLWLITGDTDTITSSVLALAGISAGTALGATIIDSSKSGDVELRRHVADVDLLAGKPQIRAALAERLAAARRELAAQRQQRQETTAGADPAAAAEQARAEEAWRDRVATSSPGRHGKVFSTTCWAKPKPSASTASRSSSGPWCWGSSSSSRSITSWRCPSSAPRCSASWASAPAPTSASSSRRNDRS
jgi:hypothetical protein